MFPVTCTAVFYFSNAKMSQKRKYQNLTIQTKAEILQKHLYQKIKVNDLTAKYDIPANKISTWKKHADKYLKEVGQISSKEKQNITSPYTDVELALLYCLKEM